jgi:hypothetical protein
MDPGTYESALVELLPSPKPRYLPNPEFLDLLPVLAEKYEGQDATLCLEMIASYGMAVGRDTFQTCVWIGRFIQAWGGDYRLVYRSTVKSIICASSKATDANIRQALIDRYGGDLKGVGGVKCQLCKGKGWTGREHTPCPVWHHPPGPLYDFDSHKWSALAVAIAVQEKGLSIGFTLEELQLAPPEAEPVPELSYESLKPPGD